MLVVHTDKSILNIDKWNQIWIVNTLIRMICCMINDDILLHDQDTWFNHCLLVGALSRPCGNSTRVVVQVSHEIIWWPNNHNPLKPVEYHSNNEQRKLKGALNCSAIMPRGISFSDGPMKKIPAWVLAFPEEFLPCTPRNGVLFLFEAYVIFECGDNFFFLVYFETKTELNFVPQPKRKIVITIQWSLFNNSYQSSSYTL